MYASKLVHNNNNWTSVSGLAQTGILVDTNKKNSYYFGLEEWINNSILRKMKVGYIDSYRAFHRTDAVDRIILFSFNPTNRQVYYVGNLYKVRQLANEEINPLKTMLNQNWLGEVQNGFHNIGDNRPIQNHIEYMGCWDSNNIVAETRQSFILNIRYEKIKLFPKKDWVNLTELIPEINSQWKRLIHRFNVSPDLEQYFITE